MRKRAASPRARLIARQSFDEVLARAADSMGARPEDLDHVPLLFSERGGFNKRMQDVMAGKKAIISFPVIIERVMSERFRAYHCETDEHGQITFRKSLAARLDLLLVVDRVHQWGLGKLFTLELAVDFPKTSLAGLHTAPGAQRRSLFWLFHRGLEKRLWSYTTKAELMEALDGCAALLERVLPAVEEQCRAALVPLPKAVPHGIAIQGALSAREAYALASGMAAEWAPDAELQGIGSSHQPAIYTGHGKLIPSLTHDGRLREGGAWHVAFLSKQLDSVCHYAVPHTGRVWWSSHAVLQGAIPKYSASLESDDWLDSTVIAPRALEATQHNLNGRGAQEIILTLRDPTRYTGAFVWEATCMTYAGKRRKRRDAIVQLDRRTGEVTGSSVR